jgi:predicted N-acyltransferase
MDLLVCCSFDEFLMDMKQSKRKNIRQERKKVGLAFQNIVLYTQTYYETKDIS